MDMNGVAAESVGLHIVSGALGRADKDTAAVHAAEDGTGFGRAAAWSAHRQPHQRG